MIELASNLCGSTRLRAALPASSGRGWCPTLPRAIGRFVVGATPSGSNSRNFGSPLLGRTQSNTCNRRHPKGCQEGGVFGGSAGGQLALLRGTTVDSGDPSASGAVFWESTRVAPPCDQFVSSSRYI